MVKQPKVRQFPPEDKNPRIQSNPESFDKQTIVWHLNILDKDGPWGWKSCTSIHFWEIILDKITSFETMTWAEILRHTNNHQIQTYQICKEAKKRLIEIGQDDTEVLYSFGLSNKPRLWGIRDGRVFKILWWDPEHTVYPSYKK